MPPEEEITIVAEENSLLFSNNWMPTSVDTQTCHNGRINKLPTTQHAAFVVEIIERGKKRRRRENNWTQQDFFPILWFPRTYSVTFVSKWVVSAATNWLFLQQMLRNVGENRFFKLSEWCNLSSVLYIYVWSFNIQFQYNCWLQALEWQIKSCQPS